MIKAIEPQDNASELAPHAYRLMLRGRVDGAEFPPLCPSCGGAASQRLEITKVFRDTDSDGPTTYCLRSARVPFCDACIARHRAQEQPHSLLDTVLSGFASMDMLGAVFPALAALFLGYLALGDALHGRGTRFLVEIGIAAVFALIAWGQGRSVWEQTARFRVPPQSDVTRAFDFSDDTGSVFESARFTCTIRNDRFANAFRILNVDREWSAHSPQAVAERKRSKRLLWLFGAVLLVVALWDLLH